MTHEPYIPERGHAVWLNFTPQQGHERSGRRPAVVVSPSAYNGKAGLALVCPITNQVKDYPFEVKIPPGLSVSGVILSDQVKSLDWHARDAEFICELPTITIKEILQKVSTLLR
jgi:mRNA interferase MazF